MDSDRLLTTSQGHPVEDDQNSLTLDQNGTILLQDIHLIDKLAKFDRERIPERVVHAQGSGAHGYFEVTNDITRFCKAKFLQQIGKQTPVLIRFSTTGGEKGSPDTERDPRGFAVKFYTEEGNFDFVGNNTPVFFIRDPLMFPDLIRRSKRNPQTNCKDPNMFWDFLSLVPESVHNVTIIYSDRGTPYSFRHMHGISGHTFIWLNEKDERFFVKWHIKTENGIKNLTDSQNIAQKSNDPEFHTRDLFQSINKQNYPSWKFFAQIMPEAEAQNYKWNIFDITKVWNKSDYPLIEVGRIILNKNANNFHAEIEQAAFAPSNLVPGIQPSSDKLLQGRLFSYNDTQRHRLGGNFDQIPVNCPFRTRVNNNQRDNFSFNGNQGRNVNYEPNSFYKYTFNERNKNTALPIRGNIGRFKPAHPNCDFTQPGVLFRKILTDYDRKNLISNIVGHLKKANNSIQERQMRLFYKCDPTYGNEVAKGLGISCIPPKL